MIQTVLLACFCLSSGKCRKAIDVGKCHDNLGFIWFDLDCFVHRGQDGTLILSFDSELWHRMVWHHVFPVWMLLVCSPHVSHKPGIIRPKFTLWIDRVWPHFTQDCFQLLHPNRWRFFTTIEVNRHRSIFVEIFSRCNTLIITLWACQ